MSLDLAELECDAELDVCQVVDWHNLRASLDSPVLNIEIGDIEDLGLGLKFICDSTHAPVLLSAVEPDGAVSANGWLRAGDQLLALNHKNISLSNKGLQPYPFEFRSFDSRSCAETITSILGLAEERLLVTAKANHKLWHEYKSVGYKAVDDEMPVTDVSSLTIPVLGNGLGITVAQHHGIFVTAVLANGDAAADGRIRVGDEIVLVSHARINPHDDGLSLSPPSHAFTPCAATQLRELLTVHSGQHVFGVRCNPAGWTRCQEYTANQPHNAVHVRVSSLHALLPNALCSPS